MFPRFIWQTMGTWKRVLHVQSPLSPSSTCALPGSYVPHFNMGTCIDSKSQISVRRWTLVPGIESLNHYMPIHHRDLHALMSSLLGKGTTTSCTNTESWHRTLNHEARTHPICTQFVGILGFYNRSLSRDLSKIYILYLRTYSTIYPSGLGIFYCRHFN